jgi:lipopolysaccharide export system permease protein
LIAKLDKLILKTFIGPFIATFFIALFAVVMQHFWKYIDEMVGKGMDIVSLLKMIGYVSLSVGVLFALPIAVLLASLMTFGNLSESFELVAIKSSGIPLIRFMRPIFIFVLGICGLALLFNNYILPRTNLKFFTLLSDVRTSKPSFDLKEGEFYTGIGNYAIQVEKKDDKKGLLKNIVIYENANTTYQDNFIVADSGRMNITPDKNALEFILYNGERTQERGKAMDVNTEFIRVQFKEYKKVFDISDLKLKKTPDSLNKGYYKMLNLSQLNYNIDSLEKTQQSFVKKIKPSIQTSLLFLQYLNDSTWEDKKVMDMDKKIKTGKDLMPDSVYNTLKSSAAEKFNTAKNQLDIDLFDYNAKTESLRSHQVEWHRKFTFSIICIVMFLIGAPLGAIIRKGGLGTPLLVAIIFFVIYFILLSVGEKSASAGTISPFTGLWLPVYGLLPVGIFLMYKSSKDAQLFNKDYYYKLFKPIRKLFVKKQKASYKSTTTDYKSTV